MSIEVRRADEDDLASWDDHVDASPQGTVFHRLDWLGVIERHSGATLHPLVGYKGQEPVGVFPVFELSKGPVRTVFSPPPGQGVPNLGPALLNYRKLKQRKVEKLNRGFVDGCLDWIEREISPSYIRVLTPTDYHDPRPFHWREFDVTPRYTYEIDVSAPPEEVLDRFASTPRRNIRKQNGRCSVRRAEADGAEFVIQQVRDRYEAQGESFSIGPEYVRDLHRSLPDDLLRVYIGEVDSEPASGIIAPVDDDTVYFWQGGVRTDVDLPVNDCIHWEIISDAGERGREQYDLVGANTPRICKYKAKFNPELASYYELEKGTRLMDLVSDVYRRLR